LQTKDYVTKNFFLAQTLTALDLWMVACICFSFFSMIEFGLVLLVKSYYEKKEQESRSGSSVQTVRPQTGKLAWNKSVKSFKKYLLHLLLMF
jgi:hypothetical protein